jgi:predicted PurR-regulated permease PerM
MAASNPDAAFIRRVLILGLLAGLAFTAVKIVSVLLMAFGAVLVSIVLRAVAEPIHRRTGLGQTASLAAAVLLLGAAGGLAGWLFGSEAARQFVSLSVSLPAAWAHLKADLTGTPLGDRLLAEVAALDGRTGWAISWVPRLAGQVVSAAAALFIVLFAGLFVSLRPRSYLDGVLSLVPPRGRPRLEAAMLACGVALRQWLVGQVGSMAMVGVSAGLALWLADVRSPLALGLLAGLGQFVPLVGPFVVAAPGVLLALADSPAKAAWTVLIYIGVGQVESNLFSPFMLRQMAKLPMALTLFAVLAFGLLLGPLGVLLATPLAVVAFVLVRTLYIDGVLNGAGGFRRNRQANPVV